MKTEMFSKRDQKKFAYCFCFMWVVGQFSGGASSFHELLTHTYSLKHRSNANLHTLFWNHNIKGVSGVAISLQHCHWRYWPGLHVSGRNKNLSWRARRLAVASQFIPCRSTHHVHKLVLLFHTKANGVHWAERLKVKYGQKTQIKWFEISLYYNINILL